MTSSPILDRIEALFGIEKLLAVVAQLRNPEGGCPWDLKQTHQTLKPYMLEEAYEAVEAIDLSTESCNSALLKEELGDVLLQVALHAQLAQDAGQFNFQDVSEAIADKLIRRHPHVFGDVTVEHADEVTRNWQAIKQAEKGAQPQADSILEGVPKGIPALSRALETSKRAVKVGFEWPSFESLWECVMSEYAELRDEAESGADFQRLEEEMGDIFFASVNLARHFKIDPEVALTRATQKFTRRFQTMEQLVKEKHPGKLLEELSFEEWDQLWNQAKTITH